MSTPAANRHSVAAMIALHEAGEGLLIAYGPAPKLSASSGAMEIDTRVPIVEAFDPIEIEYAAIRTHIAIFDQPHRATLVVRGEERRSFLNRMLTQELGTKSGGKGLVPWTTTRSFWLNRKGRIDADLRLIELPDRTLIDVDIHAAERCRAGLDAYIITEDCRIEDVSSQYHRLSLHGPAAAALLAAACTAGSGPAIADIQPGQACAVQIGAAECVIDRQDSLGEIGLELLVPSSDVASVYELLSTPWSARDKNGVTPSTNRARRIGWAAMNIARVESGWPLYYVDFGPDSLPAESGGWTLKDRVSFTKGCYLGQEVVARMHALGHPKQQLVGLRLDDGLATDTPQAITGTPLHSGDSGDAPVVGAITSSVLSPMLGQAAVAFAMIKWASAQPETILYAKMDGRMIRTTVQPSLRHWARGQ